MILINLDKGDLVTLVLGSSPYYSVFEEPLIKKCGSFTGGFVEKWSWSRSTLEQLTEEELYQIYIICKNSWK